MVYISILSSPFQYTPSDPLSRGRSSPLWWSVSSRAFTALCESEEKKSHLRGLSSGSRSGPPSVSVHGSPANGTLRGLSVATLNTGIKKSGLPVGPPVPLKKIIPFFQFDPSLVSLQKSFS